MSQTPIRRPLKRYDQLHTGSVEVARENIGKVFCPHTLEPVSRGGRLNVRMHHAPLGSTSVNYLEYGRKVRISPEEFCDFYLLQMTMDGVNEIRCADEIYRSGRGKGTVTGPGQQLRFTWGSDCREIIFRFQRSVLEQQLSALLGRVVTRPVRFNINLDRKPGTEDRWWRTVRYVVAELEQDSDAWRSPHYAVQLEQWLVCALLHGPEHNYTEELSRDVSAPAPRFVRRAEEYMESHSGDPITIADLTRVCGVSSRTLQKGFRRYRGTTALEFLKNIRLESVRNALLDARPQDTVSRHAVDHGFTQLGRFSADYRRRFGELPSTTLKR